MKNYIENNYGQVNIGEVIMVKTGSVNTDGKVVHTTNQDAESSHKIFKRDKIFAEFKEYADTKQQNELLKQQLGILLNEQVPLEKRKGAFNHLKDFVDQNLIDIQNSVVGGLLIEVAKQIFY